MNIKNEIFRIENMSHEESSHVERVPGKRNWDTAEENKEKYYKKEKLAEEMRLQQEKNEQVQRDWEWWQRLQEEIDYYDNND